MNKFIKLFKVKFNILYTFKYEKIFYNTLIIS